MSSFKKGNIVTWIGTEGSRTGRKLKGIVNSNNGSNKVRITSYNKNNNGVNITQEFRNSHQFLEISRGKLVKNENKVSYQAKIEEILAKIKGNEVPLKENGRINNEKFNIKLRKARDNLIILNKNLNANPNLDTVNKDKYKNIIEQQLRRIYSYLE